MLTKDLERKRIRKKRINSLNYALSSILFVFIIIIHFYNFGIFWYALIESKSKFFFILLTNQIITIFIFIGISIEIIKKIEKKKK